MSVLGEVRLLFNSEAFKKAVADTVADYKKAGKAAVVTTTGKATKAMQAATSNAGLGKLSKAWKSKTFPVGEAFNPAGYIYVAGGARSQGAIRAYTEGGTIRPKDGHKYLALPLPAAGKRATTPQAFEAKTGIKLQFVPAKGRRSAMLVAPGHIGKTNKYRKATTKQQANGAHATIPVFVLIPLAHLRQRFSIENVMTPFGNQLADEFTRLITKLSKV